MRIICVPHLKTGDSRCPMSTPHGATPSTSFSESAGSTIRNRIASIFPTCPRDSFMIRANSRGRSRLKAGGGTCSESWRNCLPGPAMMRLLLPTWKPPRANRRSWMSLCGAVAAGAHAISGATEGSFTMSPATVRAPCGSWRALPCRTFPARRRPCCFQRCSRIRIFHRTTGW